MRTTVARIITALLALALFEQGCSAGDGPPSSENNEPGTGGAGAESPGTGGSKNDSSGSGGVLYSSGGSSTGGSKGTAGTSGAGGPAGSGGAFASGGSGGTNAGDGGAVTVNAGANKGSLACDGTSGEVVVPASSDLYIAGDWTVESWFKDEDTAGGGNFNHDSRYILAKDGEKEAPYRFGLKYGGLTGGHIANWNKEDATLMLKGTTITSAAWHHAAAAYEATTRIVRLYVDGQLKNDPASPSSVLKTPLGQPDQAHPLTVTLCSYIAANPPYTPMGYWLGKIDDVRIWSVRRSDQQIADNYAHPLTGDQIGLVAYWTLDEGSGTTARDLTGKHDGTLKTGATFSTDVHP